MLGFLGTTTIGLAHVDILLVITPARSRVSISSWTIGDVLGLRYTDENLPEDYLLCLCPL